jgi:hypothetical protein
MSKQRSICERKSTPKRVGQRRGMQKGLNNSSHRPNGEKRQQLTVFE